jgi:hypothetical protein
MALLRKKSKLYCKKVHRTTLSPGSRSRAWGGRSRSWLDQRQHKLPDCALDQDSSACMHANTGRKFMDPVAWSKVSLRICPMRSSTHLNSILIYIFLFFGHANRSNLLALSSLMIFFTYTSWRPRSLILNQSIKQSSTRLSRVSRIDTAATIVSRKLARDVLDLSHETPHWRGLGSAGYLPRIEVYGESSRSCLRCPAFPAGVGLL